MFLFMMPALLLCTQTVQCGAEGPVYVKSGEDVLLNVSSVPEDFVLFAWKFKTRSSLITFPLGRPPTVNEEYTGRIDFTENSYSVKLKNLQQTDSGVYAGQLITSKDLKLAEYNIIVQDPVSPVQLKVDSVSSSSDSCNVTVSCRTQDADISSTFTCLYQTCGQDGGEQSVITNSAASLRVHLLNQMVVCEHSNQVSRTEDETKIRDLCPLKSSPGVSQDFSPCKVKTVVISSGLFIMVAAVISVHLIEKFNKQK